MNSVLIKLTDRYMKDSGDIGKLARLVDYLYKEIEEDIMRGCDISSDKWKESIDREIRMILGNSGSSNEIKRKRGRPRKPSNRYITDSGDELVGDMGCGIEVSV